MDIQRVDYYKRKKMMEEVRRKFSLRVMADSSTSLFASSMVQGGIAPNTMKSNGNVLAVPSMSNPHELIKLGRLR